MATTRKETAVNPRPVVYAGRFADEVAPAKLPGNCEVLDDWDVLPSRLAGALEDATALVVLDLFSFPFESMTEGQRDLPLIVVLPLGFDAAFLDTVFGGPLFGTLGPLDRVATADPILWEDLRRGYRWTDRQRVELDGDRPAEAAARVLALLEEEEAAGTLPGTVPDKAVHRVRAGALGPQFVAARGVRAEDVAFDALEVGVGSGRWAPSFDPATGLAGLGFTEDLVEVARADSPKGRFDLIGDGLAFPHPDESFDVVFAVAALHHHPAASKRTLISEMWRVARPGGRLVFLEDFVAGGRAEKPEHVVSIHRFVQIVLEATAGRVVLEHFEALRYPRDPYFRGGLISLSKVGTPQTW